MKIYEEFEHTVVSVSSRLKRIKVICEDREETRPLFEKALVDAGIEFEGSDASPDSSWGHLEYYDGDLKTRVFFKNEKQDACTAYYEGAQCIFLAAHQQFPDEELTADRVKEICYNKAISDKYDIDKQANMCLSKLTVSWAMSCSRIAKHLLNKLEDKPYVFYRASYLTSAIDAAFYRLNRGAFMHVDKWNPYDIAVISEDFVSKVIPQLIALKSLDELNDWLRDRLADNTVILVSLKKVDGDPTIYSINTPDHWEKQHDTAIFVQSKVSTGKTNFTSSNHCEIEFQKYGKPFTACFRPSSPGSAVNCELKQKGSSAQDGKISLQTTADCFHSVGMSFDVTDNRWHNQQARKRNPIILNRIWDNVNTITGGKPGIDRKEYDQFVRTVDPIWPYSMDIGSQIVKKVNSLPVESQNAFCDILYKNGAAQREDCGPYLKVMDRVD